MTIADQPWAVRHLLDVFALLAACLAAVLAGLAWAAVKAAKLLRRWLRGGHMQGKKQQ